MITKRSSSVRSWKRCSYCHLVVYSLLILLTPLLSIVDIHAQDKATKDPNAVAFIQKSIDAMGGSASFAAIKDCTVVGSAQVAPDSPFFSGDFVWKNADREFRYENARGDGTQIFVSGHGKPAVQENGSVTSTTVQAGLAATPPYLMPKFLVDVLQNPRFEISPISEREVHGRSAIRIALADGSNNLVFSLTAEVWFFDSATLLPLRLEYRIPSERDANITIGAAIEFSDFRPVSQITIPFQLASYQEDSLDSVLTLKSVQFNTGIDPSQFDLVAGGGQ